MSTSGKIIWVIGGGTISHVRPHLALAAPAYGKTAQEISRMLWEHPIQNGGKDPTKLETPGRFDIQTVLTRMAAGHKSYATGCRIETNADVAAFLQEVVADPRSKIVFMSAALCDFEGQIWKGGLEGEVQRFPTKSGKDQPRLKTDNGNQTMILTPAEKIIGHVRRERKDIFLVGFKTTTGATSDEQYMAGLKLLKTASCNLVLANDLHTKLNMVITPEQARYHEGTDRTDSLRGLVEMALLRSGGEFTRSTVRPGNAVPWSSSEVPTTLRKVVDHCIARGAYKPFLGATVGHFAVKVGDGQFLTSRRKTNFNRLNDVGLVRVESKGLDEVIAYGSRPSVGGQSQRIIFEDHPGYDCIVHFHCPIKAGSVVPVREQRPNECGSHACGRNTSAGLQKFYTLDAQPAEIAIKAVMLDQHGPNIVFSRNADPDMVIKFIEDNFDLQGRTDHILPEVAAQYAEVPLQALSRLVFIRVGTTILPTDRIRHIDCVKLESDLLLEVHTIEETYQIRGIEAVDLVMRLYPSFFEGRRFRHVRHAWAFHNLVGHPLLQVLAWMKLTKLGLFVHDNTVPRPRV